jgi:chloramphenicol O-acetyltransferase type B
MSEREQKRADMDQPDKLRAVYPHIPIGEGTYGGLRIFDWGDGTKLSIGAYCSFSFGVKVLLGGGHAQWVTQYPFPGIWPEAKEYEGHITSKGNITIGSDVWVGAEAMILSGVTIGDGAVIGARTLVNKDVAPYEIVVGSPLRVIGYRFDEFVTAELLGIAWWDWPRARIVRALPFLLSPNILDFISAVHEGKI